MPFSDEEVTELWRGFIDAIRKGKITSGNGEIAFARYALDYISTENNIKAEAWDKMWQWTIENVEEKIGELMCQFIDAIKREHEDDKLRRNGGVLTSKRRRGKNRITPPSN